MSLTAPSSSLSQCRFCAGTGLAVWSNFKHNVSSRSRTVPFDSPRLSGQGKAVAADILPFNSELSRTWCSGQAREETLENDEELTGRCFIGHRQASLPEHRTYAGKQRWHLWAGARFDGHYQPDRLDIYYVSYTPRVILARLVSLTKVGNILPLHGSSH